MRNIEDLGFGIRQIQLADHKTPYRATGYLIRAEKNILIETGAASAIPSILEALEVIDLDPGKIDAIAVTHIHLDHAGGAGLLMDHCSNAELLVHEKGKKHLVDPGKLIASAKQVYGTMFDTFFNPVLPIPAERIRVMEDREEFEIGINRKLKFIDTPGHAFHHLAIFDTKSRGVFTGDSAGIYYKRLYDTFGIKFLLPVAAPPQFEPEIMDRSLLRLSDLNPQRLYFTHFGMSEHAEELLRQARKRTAYLGKDCVEQFLHHRSTAELFERIRDDLFSGLYRLGVPKNDPNLTILEEDIKMNIKGIVTYVEKKEKDS